MCKINKPIINVKATAAKIKTCRIEAGFSVRQVQSYFNFNAPQSIYNWESGKDIPTVDNLLVLSALYKVSLDDLVIKDYVEIECFISEEKSA